MQAQVGTNEPQKLSYNDTISLHGPPPKDRIPDDLTLIPTRETG